MERMVFKSVSDERLVIDVLAPLFGKDDITVKTAKVNGGECFKITVKGKKPVRKNDKDETVPALAYDKHVEDFEFTFADCAEYGDPLFRSASGTFNSADYDLDKLTWSVNNGVVRISVPKTTLAVGKAVDACDNADAASSGVED